MLEDHDQFDASPRRLAVVGFLKAALAGGPVAVWGLELNARNLGLLGDRQSLTNAKIFKWAKKTLGIHSVRDGFGSDGEWLWSLPEGLGWEPAGSAAQRQADQGSRVAYGCDPGPASFDRHHPDRKGVPLDWVYGVNSLDRDRPPAGVPAQIWRQFIHDCEKFIEDRAAKAVKLGWTAEALFGYAPRQPLAHMEVAGLLWVLRGRTLRRIYRDCAFIEDPNAGSLVVFNRRVIHERQIKLPWNLPRRIHDDDQSETLRHRTSLSRHS